MNIFGLKNLTSWKIISKTKSGKNKMNSKIKTVELNLTRTIDASPEEVFEAWIDETSPGSPWHGVTKAIVNPPKVDSLFYSMYQLEGREIAHYGRFVTLDKPHRIQYTWISEATQGLESLVTLTLKPEGEKTVVQVKHINVPDDEGGKKHQQAWAYVLARMSTHFGKTNS
jgi:uncharacterized protein YndB with AHSA1/START domain